MVNALAILGMVYFFGKFILQIFSLTIGIEEYTKIEKLYIESKGGIFAILHYNLIFLGIVCFIIFWYT